MLRMKLESEHFRRRLVLGLLVGMLLLLSGVAELHHRRVSLADLDSSMAGGLVLAIVGNVLPALVALFVIPRLAARFIRALYDTKDLQ